MGRTFSPRAVLNYIIFAIVVLIGYKVLVEDRNRDTFGDDDVEHPRNIRHAGIDGKNHERREEVRDSIVNMREESVELQEGIKDTVEEVVKEVGQKHHRKKKHHLDEEEREEIRDKKKVDVGDLPKDLEPEGNEEAAKRDMGDLMNHKELRHQVGEKFHKRKKTGKEKKFLVDGVDWELEEEMKRRRALFQKAIENMEEQVHDGEFKDMHESDDDFAFVTAGSHSTYPAAIEFIYSVQYFFPKSKIAIFDIGLTQDERDFINSLCNTRVENLWLQFWPEALYKIRHRVWRPLLLQLALAKYFHYIYLEPGRFVNKQDLRRYLAHSRKHGVTVAGRQLKYSSFVVTSPHMYSFLKTNERKLQRTPHFDFTLLILHNTARVRNYFMRHLVACAMEDYCIAPPDSKASCDTNLANNKRYANCHRYDESAINLILNQWHNYRPEEFLVRDGITRHFDGRDLSDKVKVCNA